MSHFLDRLTFFNKKVNNFAGRHGVTTKEDRGWEDAYRQRWAHDKIVRSTHGVNCTGSCSWKIYVKGGIVTWETQYVDYPETRPDLPNHEPRGCARGASYSWYLYSANRVKFPLVRARLLRQWRAQRQGRDAVSAWQSIVEDPEKTNAYKPLRGLGGFVRASWDELTEMIAAANAYTAKTYGPDRVAGFSPIPAMSMVSYAGGTRYLSLLGGTCLSFYDWYCDLPPSSPQTWGEQTDVPESADWYNATFIMVWGSNVPQTRTPDAHFYSEVRYRGTKSVVVSPDYSEASKFADLWLSPRQGTDSALAMAMGHVILKEFHIDRRPAYFDQYCRENTDMPFLVRLDAGQGGYVPGRMVRASDFADGLGQTNKPEWKTVTFDEGSGRLCVPQGSIGFRWGEPGKWNLSGTDSEGQPVRPQLSHIASRDTVCDVVFPYFGNQGHSHVPRDDRSEDTLVRKVPARTVTLADGEQALVASVYDLFVANYGVDRGLGDSTTAGGYSDDVPYTPAWQEKLTGIAAADVIRTAREFARNAEATNGKSMVIVGAGLNHWYHTDMIYRGIINNLVMCGCVGQSGGGWSHYVGQEKLRPQVGWSKVAFALDWARPPRHMNGTSYWYAHSDQWRYERLSVSGLVAPTAVGSREWDKLSLIDVNVKAERMGWLPSSPQLEENPLAICRQARAQGKEPKDDVVDRLSRGDLRMACEDPDNPKNFPRNLFVWRANLLGSSGKGHEYFLRHLLGTDNGVQGKELGDENAAKPAEVTWRKDGPRGKLDLLVTIDFRMSTTAMMADIVLPTATWYEKDDLNTSDMHPFIHPLTKAVDPPWECRSDWEIFKSIAEKMEDVVPGHLGKEEDLVLAPLAHDSAAELGQATGVAEWRHGEVPLEPGKTGPNMVAVERDYPNLGHRFQALGPLMDKAGSTGKGMAWDANAEIDYLARFNGAWEDDDAVAGRPKLSTARQACETIMTLSPETNGHVAIKAWESLGEKTGRDHTHLARAAEGTHLRFKDIEAQPRKIVSSPIWSGIESETVSYNASWTNLHERIPWRTLTGRQQLYQDHPWMRDFGEALCVYKPPIDTGAIKAAEGAGIESNGNAEIALNFLTPHQKWGIHSTYTDNLIMLTLSRGGPIVWISERDAAKAGIQDNDWIEAYNANGALVARAVVSQRVKEGMAMMYHAQEKMVNVPGSEITKKRGGIHNSVTRVMPKPTHMVGGYAQQSYFFNYYGTIGANRDEYIMVRKMTNVEWLDTPRAQVPGEVPTE